MTSAGIMSYSSDVTSTAICGINKPDTSLLPRLGARSGRSGERSVFLERLRSAVQRHLRARAEVIPEVSTADIIRQFQSETDAILEAREPRWARVTLLTLTAMLASLIVLMIMTRLDRVVSSTSG